MNTFWGRGLVEASHVVVHLWEALLHVILSTALPHRPKAEAQRRMVELGKGMDGRMEGRAIDITMRLKSNSL